MVHKKIVAIMIIEIAGRPAEFLKEALEKHIAPIGSNKDLKLISSRISDAREIDAEKNIYSCFAEIEVEAQSLQKIMDLVFDYMPSSIEIVEPENVELNCQEATMFINDLSGRLHKYDEVAKMAQLRISQLTQALQGMQVQNKQNSSPIQPVNIQIGSEDKKKTKKKPAKKKK